MKTLSFGIIGVGRMGKVHAWNLAHHRLVGVKLAAVADIDPAALSWCAHHARGARRYPTYQAMVDHEKLDGVIIVTPHYSHPEIAEALMAKGMNVLIEKPLAVSLKAANEVVAAHKKAPSTLVGVSFNQRSNRVYQKAKALLAERKLGTIRSAIFTITTWYRSDAYYRHNPWRGSYSLEGGGSLINQCIHQIDLIYWLFGLPSSVEANCQTIDRKISAENDALALLKYSTFTLVLRAASHELKGENCLTVSGDQGKLVIHEKGMVAYFHDDEKDVNARTKVGYGHAHSHRHYYGYGLQRLVADLTRGQQLRSLRAFRDAIRGRGKLLCPVEDGVGATTLLNAIYLASWEKKEIALPFDPASYEAALEKKRQEEKQCK